MAVGNLHNEPIEVNDGLDSIVIMEELAQVPGGRTLNVEGFTGVIKSGHIIIKDEEDYKPLGVTGGAYNYLSNGESFVGVLKNSILVSKPFAAIVTMGQVNVAASPYPINSDIRAGLPRIEFYKD